ncbi:MAG TPA: AI-2E family transporter [Methyloceanibacter sp.]|nr:AI-2E family transporter [Methyloceanibacter sp.]
MPPRSPLPLLQPAGDSRARTLQGLLIATIVIGGLYFGQEVLLPLALAILLSFVLTPPLLALRRIKVPRVLAVGLVVVTAFAIIGGLGWLISREATKLAAELPSYRVTLSQKVQSLRATTSESKVLQKAGDVLSDLQAELDQPDIEPATPEVGEPADVPEREPIPVEIREPEPTGLALYRSIAGTILPPLVTAGIVLLFVVFILLQREDLRDRLIRLFGGSDLQRATSTMSDAASRLSRYFLSQVLINAAYGVFIGLALWAIGMPSPVAWGVLAMLMRFVPYVGSYIAAAFPALIAAAIDPGWTMVLMVVGLFVAGELTMGQAVEPQVFGRGTGVTPIAVIGSTIFWTWLWGPLGLLIATPITVCLAVLGRHVEGLRFFEVLLGDQPALSPEESFYQRALIGDAAEATYQAELALKDESLASYLGEVALGGLKLAEQDAVRGALDAERAQRIATTVKEMLDNLADFEPRRWFSRLRHKAEKNNDGIPPEGLAALEPDDEDDAQHIVDPARLAQGWDVEPQVLVIGGRSMLDEAAGAMLAAVLDKRGLRAEALPPETISAGHITALASTKAKLVCLSYLGLGTGPAHIRYLVRRLKRILPEGTMVLVAYWDRAEDTEGLKALLELVRADAYATTLQEAVDTCVQAATGEIEIERDSPASNGSNGKPKRPPAVTPPPKRPTPKGKRTTAPA